MVSVGAVGGLGMLGLLFAGPVPMPILALTLFFGFAGF